MLLGFEAAGRATVAFEGFDGMVQRTLYLGMELFVLQLFACNPLGRCYQGSLLLQVVHVPVARCRLRGGAPALQGHDGVQHIQRWVLGIGRFQGPERRIGRAAGLGVNAKRLRHEGYGSGRGVHGVQQCGQRHRTLALVKLDLSQVQPRARHVGCQSNRLYQHLLGLCPVTLGGEAGCLFTQVVGPAACKTALVGQFQLVRNFGGLQPVARTFVVGQQRQAGFGFETGAFELEQSTFCAVQ